jgi:hypothetical protein
MQKETWKPVKGYEGYYAVSNFGRIKSIRNNIIMKQRQNKKGYLVVNLKLAGDIKYASLHRLVAEAFIPNPDNKPQIDHIDTNPANNHVSNLRWVTIKENIHNPLTLKKVKKALLKTSKTVNIGNDYNKGNLGEKSKLHKKVRCIETGKVYCGTRECARELGYTYQGANCRISEVCRGKKESFHGLHFEYLED